VSDLERIKTEAGNASPTYIKALEAEAERLQSERDELRGALDATTSLLDRCAKRLPDPDDLRLVIGSMSNVVSVCRGLKDANATRLVKAHDNVRDTLKGATP